MVFSRVIRNHGNSDGGSRGCHPRRTFTDAEITSPAPVAAAVGEESVVAHAVMVVVKVAAVAACSSGSGGSSSSSGSSYGGSSSAAALSVKKRDGRCCPCQRLSPLCKVVPRVGLPVSMLTAPSLTWTLVHGTKLGPIRE